MLLDLCYAQLGALNGHVTFNLDSAPVISGWTHREEMRFRLMRELLVSGAALVQSTPKEPWQKAGWGATGTLSPTDWSAVTPGSA